MKDPIIEKIFEATQAAQEAEAQKDHDLAEANKNDYTGGMVQNAFYDGAKMPQITMPAYWVLTSSVAVIDPAIITGLKINTNRVRVGDICQINIVGEEGSVCFKEAVISNVTESEIVFDVRDVETRKTRELTITTEMFLDPTRHIAVNGRMAGAPSLQLPYGGNPFYISQVRRAPRPV